LGRTPSELADVPSIDIAFIMQGLLKEARELEKRLKK